MMILKEAFDEWHRCTEFPPLWLINTPFGYKSPKQITEENLDALCKPLFEAQIDLWNKGHIVDHGNRIKDLEEDVDTLKSGVHNKEENR